ncbi:MAG: tetratricopeptide repeat protein [Acidobacteriota bacterium]|nr:tetratricopeptide repeat protein [Acidobacteriota bacterium]
MHTKARLFLTIGLVAGSVSIGQVFAQIPSDVAAELDRALAQVADAPAERNPTERARRLELLGDIEVRANMLAAARGAFEEATSLLTQNAPQDRDLGRLAFKMANVARIDKRTADAERWMDVAVARLAAGAPTSPEYADALMEVARVATARNDTARAAQAYATAYEVVSKIQPGSAREAQLAEMMGDGAVRRKDLEEADRFYSRSLAVLESSQRNSIDYARVSNALAVVAASRNQAPRAQGLYETSLKIYEAQRPDSLEVSQILTNLGILQMNRGQLTAAETMFRRSLTIKTARKGAPEDLGTTHANLGLVLLEQGRLADAGAELKAAVDLRRSQAPPLEMASLLTSLARIERLRGRPDTATSAAREALELRRAQLPQTLLVAATATELGLAREAAGAWGEALPLHREALAIREKLLPTSSDVAESLERIAIVTSKGSDPIAARNAFERSVEAWSKVAPGSLDHVNVVHELGNFLVTRGDPDEGLRRLREAVNLLEQSRAARPAGTLEARAQLVSRVQAYYGRPIRILADQGNAGESFTLLDHMHERLRRARGAADEGPSALAPLDALKEGLEDGTLMIAFSVQPEATYAFVATRESPIRVYRIDEKSAALDERIKQFVERVQTRTSTLAYQVPLVADGRALFTLLFGQFESDAIRADRLLIIPDGPLDALPFSALVRNPGARAAWQYLVDWKPMVFAPSLTSAAAWSGSTSAPGSVGQLFPTASDPGPADAKLVGSAMPAGAIVSLWTPAERASDELAELFKMSLTAGRARETALLRAQRVMRDERGRTHPAYWAAFRYYGARGMK